MKMEEIKGKTKDQLNELLVGLKKEQFNLRFQASTGELQNVGRFRQIRRTIARVMTALNQDKK
jgi:large subunit ribosomal protein L29